MSARYQLTAYVSMLAAVVAVVLGAVIASAASVSITEAIGLGAVTGGLSGVLRMPARAAGGHRDRSW